MTAFRSALSIARLTTFTALLGLATPVLAHHAMDGREAATPLDNLLGGAAHVLLDAGPVALLVGAALLLAAAVAAVRRRELRA